jgi:hypothetical protein
MVIMPHCPEKRMFSMADYGNIRNRSAAQCLFPSGYLIKRTAGFDRLCQKPIRMFSKELREI